MAVINSKNELNNNATNLISLPPEILILIALYLNYYDFINFGLINKKTNRAISKNNRIVASFWQNQKQIFFFHKVETDPSFTIYSDTEKPRNDFIQYYKNDYSGLTSQQIRLVRLVLEGNLVALKEEKNLTLKKIFGIQVSKKDLVGLASLKKHQFILDFFYKEIYLNNNKNFFTKLINDNSLELHLAVCFNQLKTVTDIIQKNPGLVDAQTNGSYFYNFSPLHCAVKYGHRRLAIYLINNGAKIDYPRDQIAPIYIACLHKQFAMLKILVEKYHAKTEVHSHNMWSLFHSACASGSEVTVKYLLKKHSLEYFFGTETLCDQALLPLAVDGGNINIVLFLLNRISYPNSELSQVCAGTKDSLIKYVLLKLQLLNAIKSLKSILEKSTSRNENNNNFFAKATFDDQNKMKLLGAAQILLFQLDERAPSEVILNLKFDYPYLMKEEIGKIYHALCKLDFVELWKKLDKNNIDSLHECRERLEPEGEQLTSKPRLTM